MLYLVFVVKTVLWMLSFLMEGSCVLEVRFDGREVVFWKLEVRLMV